MFDVIKKKNSSPWISVIKELGFYYWSWYCKDYGNQGPGKPGLAVPR